MLPRLEIRKDVKTHIQIFLLSTCVSFICLCIPTYSFAETCATNGSNGKWIEITDSVPEGDCLDTTFLHRYNSGGIYARYYLEGKSNRYKILIPTSASGLSCLTGYRRDCNCNNLYGTAITQDAYNDCWNITERCYGATCNGFPYGASVAQPECTECWSVSCWHISNDNYSHRRRVYEWVCNDCNQKYKDKHEECGDKKIINWNNETCEGECEPPDDPCQAERDRLIQECGENNYDFIPESCSGWCKGLNDGPPCEDK